ncbi:MAG: class I SAM-dependent methyltransferase [Gammaproteobacteria bacterium]|nr:class I SAM-dependent methyltransferase [Gammaproteobacteria bacterium]
MDIGSGSGLFSVAAARLGAHVRSFDYDGASVACTVELKRRYGDQISSWQVSEASVLDENLMQDLGKFDIVHSWSVLHYTGDMWRAIENAIDAVAESGDLLYSDLQRSGISQLDLVRDKTPVRSHDYARHAQGSAVAQLEKL